MTPKLPGEGTNGELITLAIFEGTSEESFNEDREGAEELAPNETVKVAYKRLANEDSLKSTLTSVEEEVQPIKRASVELYIEVNRTLSTYNLCELEVELENIRALQRQYGDREEFLLLEEHIQGLIQDKEEVGQNRKKAVSQAQKFGFVDADAKSHIEASHKSNFSDKEEPPTEIQLEEVNSHVDIVVSDVEKLTNTIEGMTSADGPIVKIPDRVEETAVISLRRIEQVLDIMGPFLLARASTPQPVRLKLLDLQQKVELLSEDLEVRIPGLSRVGLNYIEVGTRCVDGLGGIKDAFEDLKSALPKPNELTANTPELVYA